MERPKITKISAKVVLKALMRKIPFVVAGQLKKEVDKIINYAGVAQFVAIIFTRS